jgi:hypothetical protein
MASKHNIPAMYLLIVRTIHDPLYVYNKPQLCDTENGFVAKLESVKCG